MGNFTIHKIDMMVSKDSVDTVDLSNETVESFNYRDIQVNCPSHQVKACKMILDARFNSLWEMTKSEKENDGTTSGEYDFTVKAFLIPVNAWYYLRFHFTIEEQRQSA